jgi:hypothetical protein
MYVPVRAKENHKEPQNIGDPVRDSNRASPKRKS